MKPAVALAMLEREGRWLLQLRDDIDTIIERGKARTDAMSMEAAAERRSRGAISALAPAFPWCGVRGGDDGGNGGGLGAGKTGGLGGGSGGGGGSSERSTPIIRRLPLSSNLEMCGRTVSKTHLCTNRPSMSSR